MIDTEIRYYTWIIEAVVDELDQPWTSFSSLHTSQQVHGAAGAIGAWTWAGVARVCDNDELELVTHTAQQNINTEEITQYVWSNRI